MIAVLDASPVCYLVQIGEAGLLPRLFAEVHIPASVIGELLDEAAPEAVCAWAESLPPWVRVSGPPSGPATGLEHLHPGERAAILLAEALSADLVILDEKAARRAAAGRGLRVIGLLGLLVEAAARGLVDLPAAVGRLSKTNFRCSATLLKAILDRRHGK